MFEYLNDKKFIYSLKVLCDYMILNQDIEKSDVIIGCGCKYLDIPIKCAELYNDGMAKKILFAGGLGKGTSDKFKRTEAEIFKDIAIKHGVLEKDIIIENKSTNTGDNFKYGINLLNKLNIKSDSIIIVHNALSERRTFSTGNKILKSKKLYITSPNFSFENFINYIKKDNENGREDIEILLGDIQRIVVYPQFGWQIENNISTEVVDAYNYIKNLGFTKYLITKEKIYEMIKEKGIVDGQKENYFY